MTSVFADFETDAYPYRFAGTLLVRNIAGGTPSDPNVAEAWLKTKLADKDDLIREMVADIMVERDISFEEAVEQADILKHLNGFKRDRERGGELYIEGRQLKSALKEAAMVAVNAGKLRTDGWAGPGVNKNYAKHLKNWLPEHIFVVEERLYLGTTTPSGIVQRFVTSRHGTGISYEEYVEDAKIDFTIASDYEFSDHEWAMLWLTGQEQGIGASRSQGFGRYQVVRWEAS